MVLFYTIIGFIVFGVPVIIGSIHDKVIGYSVYDRILGKEIDEKTQKSVEKWDKALETYTTIASLIILLSFIILPIYLTTSSSGDTDNTVIDTEQPHTTAIITEIQSEKESKPKDMLDELHKDEYKCNESSSRIKIVRKTARVDPGKEAEIRIKCYSNKEHEIAVFYDSGRSSAGGLKPKRPSNGYITWTWTVGTRTRSGVYDIIIYDGENYLKTTFVVK